MERTPADDGNGTEFRVVVWARPGQPWRARIVPADGSADGAADRSELDFSDPFALARFLSWPRPTRTGRPGSGLR